MNADFIEHSMKTSVSDAGLDIKLPVIPLPASIVENGLPTLSVSVMLVVKPFTVGLDISYPQSWEIRMSLHDVTPAFTKQGIEDKNPHPSPLHL